MTEQSALVCDWHKYNLITHLKKTATLDDAEKRILDNIQQDYAAVIHNNSEVIAMGDAP